MSAGAHQPGPAQVPALAAPQGPRTAPLQLRIDGGATPLPPRLPRRLTERQRELLRWARWHGAVTTRDARRWYAAPSGACARLVDMGLLERTAPGRFRPGAGIND